VRLEAVVASGAIVSPDELRKFTKTATIGLDYASSGFRDDCDRSLESDRVEQKGKQARNSIDHYEKVASEKTGLPGQLNLRWDMRVHSTFSILVYLHMSIFPTVHIHFCPSAMRHHHRHGEMKWSINPLPLSVVRKVSKPLDVHSVGL
jgi:hypothetical protein